MAILLHLDDLAPEPSHAMSARFVFAVTQAGAERALKNEIAREHPDLRFAFSRPGFVTFRAAKEIVVGREVELRSVFARTWGYSIGKLGGDDAIALARDAWRLVGAEVPGTPFPHVHVWQRERPLPGDEGFDGAADELARTIGALLVEQRPEAAASAAVNAEAAAGELVLDCVLVERHEWWLGWHRAASPETRWPGGVPQLAIPAAMISRAYLKIVEALEVVGAPGGCRGPLRRDRQRAGRVVPRVARARAPRDRHRSGRDGPHRARAPDFTHVRARAKDVKRERVPRLPLARDGRERRAELHARHARWRPDGRRRRGPKVSC